MNEVDAGRDRATPASVRHDDDEPLTPNSPCYYTRAGGGGVKRWKVLLYYIILGERGGFIGA
jgi:hypothetical protein